MGRYSTALRLPLATPLNTYRGCHVQGIARELGITDRAVYNARKRLREILDVETNEQIVAEALRRGLLRGEG